MLPTTCPANTARALRCRGRAITIAGALAIAGGCRGVVTNVPIPSTVSGHVALEDTWENSLDDPSGVAVGVSGSSAAAVTDKNGDWQIKNLPAGRYDFTFTKSTFGTMRLLGSDVSGTSAVIPEITMAVTPTFQAIIDSVYRGARSGIPYIFITGHITERPPANAKETVVVIFLSATNPGVSSDPATYDQWSFGYNFDAGPTFTVALDPAVTQASFAPDTALFVVAYAKSAACSCYVDSATNKRVFSTAGPRGNVMRFSIQ